MLYIHNCICSSKIENRDLEWVSNLPRFFLSYSSHTGFKPGSWILQSLRFFFLAAWKSGNAKIQMQDLSYVKYMAHYWVLEQCQKRNYTFFLVRARYPGGEGDAPHSSTLAWKVPWRRSLVGYSPWGREESDTTEWLHFHFSVACIREGNGSPLQYSCLENPRDGSLVGCRLWGCTELDMPDVT